MELIQRVLLLIDAGKTHVGIFIDLSKALDHTILIQKLNHYGLAELSLTLCQNYLANKRQYVQFNEMDSELMTIGVPQDSLFRHSFK